MIFVPGTAPGDVVQIRITQRKPRYLEGEIVEIVQASTVRRRPPCVVADRCGGCAWQHVEYPAQVQQKEKILRDSLKKIERMQPIQWGEFIAAREEFHYRNRIQLQIRGGKFGFFAKRTRDLIPITRCWIAEEKINHRLNLLTPEELTGTKLEIAVRTDGETVLMAEQRDPEEALFSQVNSAQNENLIRAMESAITIQPDWIMDLYCGEGNLTRPLARKFPGVKVLGVELSRTSIERAPRLAEINFQAGDVAQVLRSIPTQPGSGLIVLDPPRSGCDQSVLDEICRHKPRQIVYVSCNPTTFARDAERLISGGIFRVESVQGLDMFPQTEHVELISSLCAAT